MKILITGGAGFIGSQVADAYIAAGHEVAIIDNFVTGNRENVPKQATLFEIDIEDAEAVTKAITTFAPDVVNHHAAQVDVRVAVEDPLMDAKRNIFGSLNLILAAQQAGVKKFIYANSGGAGYGDPKPEHIPCTEDTPMSPISPYGVSKTTVERYLYSRSITHGLQYVALRYGNVFGPRQTFGEAGVCAIFTHMMLNNEQPTIFGDGSSERDYCFVGDVVAANVAALRDDAHGAYNVGTGKGTTTNEVFAVVKDVTGYAGDPNYAPERPGEIQRIVLDSSRLQHELGWKPSTTFADGIAQTVAWMRNGK